MSEHATGQSNWTAEEKKLYWQRRQKGLRGQLGYATVFETVKDEKGEEQLVPVGNKIGVPFFQFAGSNRLCLHGIKASARRSLRSNVRLVAEGSDVAGTKIGGRNAAITNKEKYGFDFYAKIGAIGGKRGHTGGYYANRELARRCGFVGGSISRRGKNKLTEKERREIRKAYEELLAVHTKANRQREYKARLDEGATTVFDRKRGLIKI